MELNYSNYMLLDALFDSPDMMVQRNLHIIIFAIMNDANITPHVLFNGQVNDVCLFDKDAYKALLNETNPEHNSYKVELEIELRGLCLNPAKYSHTLGRNDDTVMADLQDAIVATYAIVAGILDDAKHPTEWNANTVADSVTELDIELSKQYEDARRRSMARSIVCDMEALQLFAIHMNQLFLTLRHIRQLVY